MSTLLVLNRWKRPIDRVIAAWRGQCDRTVVVDNSGDPSPIAGVDDVWKWGDNLGCFGHFAPAFMLHGYDYVLFADDDFIPTPNAHATLLADTVLPFATLGPVGRVFRDGIYVYGNAPVGVCDCTCRCHLVEMDTFNLVLNVRRMLLYQGCPPCLVDTHDDLIMCLGLQLALSLPSRVTRSIIAEELPQDHAVYRRPGHLEERREMVRRIYNLGWRSLV